jgi:uncharacterized repeat protein (TIGR01451 family)
LWTQAAVRTLFTLHGWSTSTAKWRAIDMRLFRGVLVLVSVVVVGLAMLAGSVAADVPQVPPLQLFKSFSSTTMFLNGTTTMTLTIGNSTASTVTGVAVFDTLPSGMTVAGSPNISNTCGGTVTATAFGGTVALSGGTLGAVTSCAVKVDVTATSLGQITNTTSPVSSTETGNQEIGSASITVVSPPTVLPPTLTKSFDSSSIPLNGTTILNFGFTNPNPTALTGVTVTDPMPAGLVVVGGASGSLCGGTFSSTPTSLSITGLTLPPTDIDRCALAVLVRGTTSGTKVNTTSQVTSTNGGTGSAATATLVVQPAQPPTLTKAFAPSTVAVGGTTRLTFTLTNPNPFAAVSRITFADPFPGGLGVAATPAVINGCGGVPSVGPFALAVAYANARLPAGGSCTWSVNVTAGSAGVKTNTTTIVSSSAGIGSPATGTLTVTP